MPYGVVRCVGARVGVYLARYRPRSTKRRSYSSLKIIHLICVENSLKLTKNSFNVRAYLSIRFRRCAKYLVRYFGDNLINLLPVLYLPPPGPEKKKLLYPVLCTKLRRPFFYLRPFIFCRVLANSTTVQLTACDILGCPFRMFYKDKSEIPWDLQKCVHQIKIDCFRKC